MNSLHTYLFQKGFLMVYSGDKGGTVVILPHIAQRKHSFLGEIKQMSKTKNYHIERKLL